MAKTSRGGGNTTALVEALVTPVAREMGLEVWDVRFEKEGPDWFLRVLIQRPGGLLDTDTCEAFSRAIDPILDREDPIDQSYYLEVGSPGLGRRLTRPAHYQACMGQLLEVRLIRPDESGQREYEGALTAADGQGFTLDTPAGEKTFPYAAASFVKLCDDRDLF